MKANRFKMYWQAMLILAVVSLAGMTSCKEEEEAEKPVASFQFAVSETNYLEVVFTNYSQNATSYTWNFGDGTSSTEKDPTHVFAAAGTYEVSLTAKNEDESAVFSKSITITDPNEASKLLTGETSKTWQLYRVGTSMGVGPDAAGARTWWSLDNTGSRPCVYHHSFTFKADGSFVFDDAGLFWGEEAVFSADGIVGNCFEAIASNMVNKDGADVSAWLSGTHAFVYNVSEGTITLNGNGAWMGLPQLGTSAESIVPEATKTFKATIEQHTGYDLLTISYAYAELYWDFTYASYSDPSLQPEVVEEEIPYGEDLPNETPTALYNTFASTSATDVQDLIPTESAVVITPGVDDPADATAAKVGKYQRGTEQYSDLKFQLEYDCQFDNFTTVSIDVYVPSSNTYSEGGLTKNIQIWIADASQTEQYWNSWVVYNVDLAEVVTDEWKTYTFQIETPSEGSVGTPKTRQDLDLVGLSIGGSGHTVDGTFYIRNFKFE